MKIATFILFACLISSGCSIYSFSFKFTVPPLSSWIPSLPSIPYLDSFSSVFISSNTSEPSEAVESTIPQLSVVISNPDVTSVTIDLRSIQMKAEEFYKKISQTILEDATLSLPNLVTKHGYPCETHTVVTPDGYILTMHRIPHGKTKRLKKRPVIFLQHGILASSADWLISEPEKALGYILADAGYDVWLANNRGNKYSKNHTSLSPDDGDFWNFSWHEIALYDTTTMIDYALNSTKQKKLYYIGHSQGTTVFYVMCSEKPEYNEKIKAMFSLAPVAFMTDINSPILQFIARGQGQLGSVLEAVGAHEFLPHNRVLGIVGNVLCRDESITQILCTNSLFAVAGYSDKQMNTTLLPIIMRHTPAGSATKQLLHYAQEMNSGEFCQWDHGSLKNVEVYGSETPAKYKLDKITAPVYLFYSKSDWLSSEKDVAKLYTELKNVKGTFLIADDTFNHLDYLFGIEAPELVYKDIRELLKKH